MPDDTVSPQELTEATSSFDVNAEPLVLDQQAPAGTIQNDLAKILGQLRVIADQKAALDLYKDQLTEQALSLLKLVGRPVTFVDPVTGQPKIASPRRSVATKVNATSLLVALIEYYGDADQATMVWEETLKPREVDTKADGLLMKITARHSEEHQTVPPSVIAKVVRFKESASYVGFT